ncbi:MAG: GNAT family N-acetyltransferase [Chromatiales bacterium]|jgi:GNAT superfamily N-acetyltransferase
MVISRYTPEHEKAVLSAIRKEPDWEIFTARGAIDNYRKRLEASVTYVCHDQGEFCGYLRAILDDAFALYISELYVVPEKRNQMVGRSLLARVGRDFHGLNVYVLSDEDAFYEKAGYKRVGSVFQIGAPSDNEG